MQLHMHLAPPRKLSKSRSNWPLLMGKRFDSPGGSRPPIPRTQRRTRVLWAPPYRFPSISFLPHEPTFLHARQSNAAPTPNSMGDLAGGAALAPDTGASPHRRRPTTAHPIAGPHGYLGRTPEISPPRYHRLPLPRGEAELRLPSGSSSTVVDHCLLFLFRVAPHLPTAECPRSRQPSGATTTLPPALPRPCRRISGSHSGAKAPRRHLGRRRA